MAKKAYVGIKALPDGYTEVEYIEGTGTQYIDSGFIPNGKTRIIMDVEIVSHLDHGAYFGTRAAVSGTDSVSNTLFIMSDGALRSDFYGNTKSSTGIPEGRHILDRNMNVTTAGDYTITQTASTTASTYPLAIFGVNTAGEVSKCACIKLYSCSIYDDGVLARKFIPCLNSDGVAGMYDCVGNAFYGNGGSREFLFGSYTNNTVISKVLKNIYVGAEKEFPVYDVIVPQTVITTSNITNYFTVSNGSYYFSGSGDKFTSNNKGVHGTTATTTLTAKQDYTLLSFTYSYSGEAGCDYLNLRVNGVAIETNAYGSTTTKTYTGSILAGQTIEFSFRKDGSVDRYDDCATWSNMVVEQKTQSGTENRVVARRISKIYIGDSSGIAKLIYDEDPWNKLVSNLHAPYVKTRGVHFTTAVALSAFNPFYTSSYGGSTSFPPSSAFQVWINKELTNQSYQSITCNAGDDVLIKLIDDNYYYPLFHQYNTSNNYYAAILDPYPQMYMSSGVLATDWNRCFQSCLNLSSVHKYFLCNNPQITNMNYFFWNSSSHTAPTPIYINARGVSTATNWYNGVTNTVAFYVIDGSVTKSTFSSSSNCTVAVWDGDMSDCVLPK